jgi:lysozyme family protein
MSGAAQSATIHVIQGEQVADLIQSFNYTMKFEDASLSGKITPDPSRSDPNAVARFGINSASNPQAIKDGFYDMGTAAALSYAQDVFKYDYFSPIGGYQISDQNVCNKVADLAFNEGCAQAIKIVQRALNVVVAGPIAIDGKVGQQTLDAINAADSAELLMAIKSKAKDFYVALASANPSDIKDLDGWIARVNA